MRSKGIAIRTILLLLIGVLVVGIVVYMVYRYFVKTPLSEQECRARMVSWCTSCAVANWTSGYAPGSELAECSDTNYGTGWSTSPPANCGASGVQAACAGFTP